MLCPLSSWKRRLKFEDPLRLKRLMIKEILQRFFFRFGPFCSSGTARLIKLTIESILVDGAGIEGKSI